MISCILQNNVKILDASVGVLFFFSGKGGGSVQFQKVILENPVPFFIISFCSELFSEL